MVLTWLFRIGLIALWCAGCVVAQDSAGKAGVRPEAAAAVIDDEELEAKIARTCAERLAAGVLVPVADLLGRGPAGDRLPLAPVPQRTAPLAAPDVHDLVRPSLRIVGHYYRCTECEDWHFDGATGFCVAPDGAIATCRHVLPADEGMREAYLVVADLAGNVWPVERVVAADESTDVCVVQTAERGCVPLPLRDGVRAGERVYCLSNPDRRFASFSEGIVARWFADREAPAADAKAKAADAGAPRPAVRWLQVTCDFARGSSGAPIVDACGNVVAVAQSTATIVHDEEAQPVDTQMTAKIAAPAAALSALCRGAAR